VELELAREGVPDARQFEVTIRRLADGLAYGADHSPFVGAGIEYVQSRRYQPGDPVRAIDWRVTARTGRYHVKEYEAPRRVPAWLLVDTSASMTLSSGPRSKYGVAVHLAGGLALACLDRASPAGVLGAGERPLHMRPSMSRGQVMQWLHLLRRYRVDEQTTLGRRIAELAPSLTERSLVFVLSDLHDPAAPPALRRLAQAHDVVALQLVDPAEEGLVGAGFLRAQEAETGRAFAAPARRAWVDPEATGQDLRRGAVDHLVIRIDQPFVHRLRHFLRARGLLGRGAR
jgi:uncharacterized protein (DUF58 family)